MAARTGSAIWTGDLQDGSGRLVVGPQRWEADYSFRSRFTDDAVGGTNPEELLAAAHAGCFSRSLTHVLTQAGSIPRSVATSARVRLHPVDGVPTPGEPGVGVMSARHGDLGTQHQDLDV